MTLRQKLSTWLLLATMAVLLAMSWTIALAQPDSDGDALDGDELGLPIVLGVAVVAYVGWMLIRRSSRKSA